MGLYKKLLEMQKAVVGLTRDKGCERYDLHCKGIEKIGDATLIQPTLF